MMTDEQWKNLASLFCINQQNKIQKFIQQLNADHERALYKYLSDKIWYDYISVIMNCNLHCKIIYPYDDEESQEFIEFIDGNGFQVQTTGIQTIPDEGYGIRLNKIIRVDAV